MKTTLLTLFTILFSLPLFAQNGNVGIGTNNPDQSAQLEVSASDKGVLFPRVDLATATFTGGPAEGLLVWNTNIAYGNGTGYYVNIGTKIAPDWVRLETEKNASLEDIGIVVAFPGNSYPNDIYLPLSGGTYNDADYPEFAAFIPNLDSDVVTDNGNGTFTLGNWNANGEFLRGQGGNAGGIGSIQNNATALPSSSFITNTIGNHDHLVDPPSTSTSTIAGHTHNVDPPSTSTSTNGNHNHDFYTAHNDINGSGSQGYPAGNIHQAFRTTDRRQRTENNNTIQSAGSHNHTINIGSFLSGSSGSHAHNVNISSFYSGSAGAHNHTITTGGDVETRPVNRSILWVIKVKPSSSLADTLIINNITNTMPIVDDADWHVSRTTNGPTAINQNIYTDGNVGIGLFAPGDPNNPQDKLHLKGTGGVRGFVETTSTSYAGMRYKNANGEFFTGIDTNSDKFVIYDNSASAVRVSVESTGELRANDGLQVGGGTSMSNIQSGSFNAGSSTGQSKSVTMTFPVAFSSVPIVIATPRNQVSTYGDKFSVTTYVTSTSVIFNIRRLDASTAWGQDLHIDWIAIGL